MSIGILNNPPKGMTTDDILLLLASNAVTELLNDLLDHRGLRKTWESIDEDPRIFMREELVKIMLKYLKVVYGGKAEAILSFHQKVRGNDPYSAGGRESLKRILEDGTDKQLTAFIEKVERGKE